MSDQDQIVGTAILTDKNPHDGFEYLYVLCVSPSRKTVQTAAIPVVEQGQPAGKGWHYSIQEDVLQVTPSLKLSMPVDREHADGEQHELFHNGGSWKVKFVRKPLDEASIALHELNHELRENLKLQWK